MFNRSKDLPVVFYAYALCFMARVLWLVSCELDFKVFLLESLLFFSVLRSVCFYDIK